jgi:type I restriction enzyme R subunit
MSSIEKSKAIAMEPHYLESSYREKLIADLVEQIDRFVKVIHFNGWLNSSNCLREMQKALLLAQAQFGLCKDRYLFAKAYVYIEEHY